MTPNREKTRSKERAATIARWASPSMNSTVGIEVLERAASNIAGDRSMPTTRPPGAVLRASSMVVDPVPQPTSRDAQFRPQFEQIHGSQAERTADVLDPLGVVEPP